MHLRVNHAYKERTGLDKSLMQFVMHCCVEKALPCTKRVCVVGCGGELELTLLFYRYLNDGRQRVSTENRFAGSSALNYKKKKK